MFVDLEFIGKVTQYVSIDGMRVGSILESIQESTQRYYIELFTDERFLEHPYPTEAEALFALRDRYLKKKYGGRNPPYDRRNPSYDRRNPPYDRRSPSYESV